MVDVLRVQALYNLPGNERAPGYNLCDACRSPDAPCQTGNIDGRIEVTGTSHESRWGDIQHCSAIRFAFASAFGF